MPDESWGSTITMVHPLFQAFNVSCNIGSIPEGTSADGTQGTGAGCSQTARDRHSPSSTLRCQFSVDTLESSADTSCGARNLQGLFKGHQSPSLKTSSTDSSLQKDRQDLSKEKETTSQAIKHLDKVVDQKGPEVMNDSEHDYSCLEENTEAEESEDFADERRKESSDSSDLDLTEPVVSVSRFHYLI